MKTGVAICTLGLALAAPASGEVYRLPITGAPILALLASDKLVVAAGPSGIYTSKDAGRSYVRLGDTPSDCGPMELVQDGGDVVFHCITSKKANPVSCLKLGTGAPVSCDPGAELADSKIERTPAAVSRRVARLNALAEPYRKALGLPAKAGKVQLVVAKVKTPGRPVILVGHEELGVFRSEDGKRFVPANEGLFGLAGVAIKKATDSQGIVVALGAISVRRILAGEGGAVPPYVKVAEARCELGKEPRCQVTPVFSIPPSSAAFPSRVSPTPAPEILRSKVPPSPLLKDSGDVFALWPMPPEKPIVIGTARGVFYESP